MIETRTDHPLAFDSPAGHGETIVCSPLSFWLVKVDVLAGAARLVSREKIVQMEKFKPSILLLYIRGEVSGNSEDQQTFIYPPQLALTIINYTELHFITMRGGLCDMWPAAVCIF